MPSPLAALSPLDGRYARTAEPLRQYFSEQGLTKVELKSFSAGLVQVEALAAGSIDISMPAQAPLSESLATNGYAPCALLRAGASLFELDAQLFWSRGPGADAPDYWRLRRRSENRFTLFLADAPGPTSPAKPSHSA